MNSKKIFPFFILIFGEALIIVSFLYFGKNLSTDLLVLNTIVSSIIYSLYFIDIIIPWIDFNDKSHKTIGSIGIRWVFTFIYMILAIGVMIFFNTYKPLHITLQLIVHSGLFFFLLLGLSMAVSASGKVKEIYIEEKQNRDHIDEMKKITKEVQLKFDQMTNIPDDIISKVNELQESLRYISPTNNVEAIELESKYVNQMRIVSNCLIENPLDFDKIIENINNCKRNYKERKQIFSN
ncbi:MAG: hypothetical protein WCL51_10965 [Bacteroidota bacterium]